MPGQNVFFGVLYVFVLFNFQLGICVGRFEDKLTVDTNTINQDERRGASVEQEDLKTSEQQTSLSYRSRFLLPSGYDGSGYDSHGPSGQYLPPYFETGSHPGGYGFYHDTEHSHHHAGYGHHHYRTPSGHGGSHSSYGGLALKGLLIPLAGIALLGAAAALSTNPVLLQLGVLGGRRRRSISEIYPVNPKVKPEKIT